MNTVTQNNPVEKTRRVEMMQAINRYRKGNETMALHTQDPEYKGYSGVLKTDMTIGASALVEVTATVDDDEFIEFIVMYRGVDIADALNEEAFLQIEMNIKSKWVELVALAKKERLEEEGGF